MNDDLWTTYESPLGPLTLIGGETGLAALHFPGRSGPLDESRRDGGAFAEAVRQLDEYFAGERTSFELPLDLRGTNFQQRVWATLRGIPYGTTRTYTSLANAVGRTDHVRAAAAAVGKTPVPIVVPCHRVIASNGDLTGYLGGLQRKRALLEFEAGVSQHEPAPAVWAARQLSLL